jgi:hypothetical protein
VKKEYSHSYILLHRGAVIKFELTLDQTTLDLFFVELDKDDYGI